VSGDIRVANENLGNVLMPAESDGGFFIFGDLSIRKIGRHRMRFNLFNTDKYARQVDDGRVWL